MEFTGTPWEDDAEYQNVTISRNFVSYLYSSFHQQLSADPLSLLKLWRSVRGRRSSSGPVRITPLNHASTLIEAGEKFIYLDPAKPR
jgi:hypothetical protein